MQQQQNTNNNPPPPPGFMTIMVQVPPSLGPNRQMVVYVNPSYPIQVTIPPGLQPGTLVPVYCPIPRPPQPQYYQGTPTYHPPPN